MLALVSLTRNACRLCEAELISVFTLPSTPAANAFQTTRAAAVSLPKFPLEVNQCTRCEHFQLGVVVDAVHLFSDYAYTTGSSPALVEHFSELAGLLVAELEKNNLANRKSIILEVGSNDGSFLAAMRTLGCNVLGVEPAKNLAEAANDCGIATLNTFFNEKTATLIAKDGLIDAFVATNVFAHIDDLRGALSALKSCAHEQTIGVIEVQYVGALLEKGHFDNIYHEHLDYHGARTFGWALANTGWNVTRIEKISTHGGSLRFWVKNSQAGGRFSVGEDSSAYLQEGTRDFTREWKTLAKKVCAVGAHLREQLRPYNRVLCYGAPAKLTTLMYGLGLEQFPFIGVIDDAPSKQFKFTPGMGLQVLPATALKEANFDAVLVCAWNYSVGIKQKLRNAGVTVPVIVPFE